MQASVARAFKWLAYYVNLSGRRYDRLYALSRARFIPVEPNAAQAVKMAPRALRRELQGREFIPVYGYHGGAPHNPPHKKMIWAMKAKDRKQALRYQKENG